MQSVSSRIWNLVAVAISYDDNHYTTGTTGIKMNMYDTTSIWFRHFKLWLFKIINGEKSTENFTNFIILRKSARYNQE